MLTIDKFLKSINFLVEWFISCFVCNLKNSKNKIEISCLDNGLELICIQNTNFEKSMLELIIDAGSNNNPETHLGLAHLVEHMMFHSSKKYPKGNGIYDYAQSHSGSINASTTEETMKFTIRIGHKRLSKIADMLANVIAEPTVENIKCENEVEIIEHEYKMLRKDFSLELFYIFKNKIDSKYAEHFFTCGNRASLNKKDIGEKVNSFKKDYFTANRMKLVITSKMNINELKAIGDFFKVISKGKLKKGVDSKMEKSLEIPFNDKYEIQTLNVPLKAIEYNSKAAGSIIRFYSKEHDYKIIFVSILVPGKFSFHEYKFNNYLIHALKTDWDILIPLYFKESAISSNMIFLRTQISKRMTTLNFEITLHNKDENTVDSVLQQLHTFLHILKPNQKLSEYFNCSLSDNFEEPTNEIEITKAYGDLIYYNIKKDLKAHMTSFPFDKEFFKSFFEYVANIDNWCVFLPTNDKKSLTESHPFFSTLESKPIKIKLTDNYSKDAEKKKQLLKFFENTEVKTIKYTPRIKNHEQNKKTKKDTKTKIDKKKQIFHKEFEHGEYTAVNCVLEDPEPVQMVIDFFANTPYENSIEQDLRNSIYLKNVCNLHNKISHNCSAFLKINRVKFLCNDSKNLLHSIKIFKSLLNDPLEEIQIKKLEHSLKLDHYDLPREDQIYTILNYVTKTDNSMIPYNDNYKYPKSYYVDLTLYAENADSFAEDCYKLIKSNDIEKMNLLTKGKTFEIEIFDDKEECSTLFAFDLGKNKNGKQFGMALILKAVYLSRTYQTLRQKHQLCYRFHVEEKIIKDRSFLIIHVLTTSSQEKVIEAVRQDFLKYSEFINGIHDDDFKTIKEDNLYEIKSIFSNFLTIQRITELAKSLGIYTLNFQEIFERTFENIVKKDLLDLSLEKFDPIILKEVKKSQ